MHFLHGAHLVEERFHEGAPGRFVAFLPYVLFTHEAVPGEVADTPDPRLHCAGTEPEPMIYAADRPGKPERRGRQSPRSLYVVGSYANLRRG